MKCPKCISHPVCNQRSEKISRSPGRYWDRNSMDKPQQGKGQLNKKNCWMNMLSDYLLTEKSLCVVLQHGLSDIVCVAQRQCLMKTELIKEQAQHTIKTKEQVLWRWLTCLCFFHYRQECSQHSLCQKEQRKAGFLILLDISMMEKHLKIQIQGSSPGDPQSVCLGWVS